MTIEKYNYYALRVVVVMLAFNGLVNIIANRYGYCFTPHQYWKNLLH